MEKDKIIKPRFCLFPCNKKVVIAGENGWTIFNVSSKKNLLEKIQKHKIKDLAINENLLAVTTEMSDDKQYRLYIYSINEKGINLAWSLKSPSPISPIAASNHTVFSYHENKLKLYDYRDKQKMLITIPYDNTAHTIPHISCHPTKTEFIYPSSKTTLCIVQPHNDTLVKMHLTTDLSLCDGADYNPNGTMLAIKANLWRYFICDIEHNDPYAYELSSNDAIYVSSIFHPYYYIFLLLSDDNIIEGWDYMRRALLFTTYPLKKAQHTRINPHIHSKRLAISPDGMQLLVALEDKWSIIPIPQNNLFTIYTLLYKKNLPKNLKKRVIRTIIGTTNFSQFNITELSKVKMLPPIHGGIDLSKKAVEPTKKRKITAVYRNK